MKTRISESATNGVGATSTNSEGSKIAASPGREKPPEQAIHNPQTCPICSTAMSPLYLIDRFDPPLDIWRCASCGLQKNCTVPKDLESLYSDDYYSGQAEYAYRDERKSEEYHDIVWQARLKTIAKTHRPPGSFLDIGCSFGGFVDAASRFGYRAVGLDLSSFAVKEGRKLGRDLRQGELSPNIFSRNQFDVITMIEVMEHLPDPMAAIQCISRWIKPGGLLVIQTANFLGRQAIREGQNYHYYLPGHLYYYSSRNLSTLLGKHEFVDFHIYRGVDFGLLPKLKKMRGQWKAENGSNVPISRLAATSIYHLKSRIAWRDFALTSSMVLYARKGAL